MNKSYPGILSTRPYFAMCSDKSSVVYLTLVLRLVVVVVAVAEAEKSFVDLLAIIEQNRRGNDGHESLRFTVGFV